MRLEACSLALGYGGPAIVQDLSLGIKPGSITAIIGANGSGKSTVLKSMARILKPEDGTLYLDGKALQEWRGRELARKMALLPQAHGIPDDLRVRDLVAYGRFPHRGVPGNNAARDRVVVDRALALTKLLDFQDRPLHALSGGERQRAWLALALAQEPRLLLLDEPTTYLDVRYQFEVLDLVRELNSGLGITVVMVLHDLNHASRYAQRIVALKEGKLLADGSPAEVLTPATLREAFGIEGIISHECGYPHFIATGRCRTIA